MKSKMRQKTWIIVISAISLVPSISNADFLVDVTPSSAPNFSFPVSGSWEGYAVNAMNSLQNGLGNIGDRNVDPASYLTFQDNQSVSIHNAIISNFPSWLGQANPSAPFNGERGNRMHFGVHIAGDGFQQFRMEDISFEMTSDNGNIFGFAGNLSGGSYSGVRIGVDWGANNMKGGGDDIIYTSGPGTMLIDEFFYVGVGNAFNASAFAGSTEQEKIDQVIQQFAATAPTNLSTEYTLRDASGNFLASGSSSVRLVARVPEPSTGLMLLFGGIAMVSQRKRSI